VVAILYAYGCSKFPEGLKARFFCRELDYRAKLVCEWASRSGRSRYSCISLDKLHVQRYGGLLQYSTISANRGRLLLWVTLRFTTIESERASCSNGSVLNATGLVLFHCTFLSLRSHDSGKPVKDIQDYELRDETPFFAGYVESSSY